MKLPVEPARLREQFPDLRDEELALRYRRAVDKMQTPTSRR
jgi:hypothetical protein